MIDGRQVERLKVLHAKRLRSELAPGDLPAYQAAVTQFLAEVLEAQNRQIRSGHQRRGQVRVPRSLGLELAWPGGRARTVTLDVGMGGFSAVLAVPPPPGATLAVELRMRRGEAIRPRVCVTGARKRRGSARVSFAFEDLSDRDRARLEAYALDELLAGFRPGDAPAPAPAQAREGSAPGAFGAPRGELSGRALRQIA